ncbi:hypothetical protein MSG28_014146 [Choristoneura fumiferana]|uniref:Uncharacterized protein n=1 Tax=Choristoneura fumiferana TaxID=7141 RepID=A0ACC0JG62_CHOFU|nr:hypothetical protein MSG28_014146 [Choristoneura fumiferana]
MELFRSETYYIFVRNESSLWWNRLTGAFSVRSAWDLSDIEDIECLGITEGIIGVVEHTNIYEPRLMIIKESVPVGQIYFHHTVYKIKSICFLNMGTANQDVELCVCTKHGSSSSVLLNKMSSKKIGGRLFENSAFLNKTVGAVKNVSNTIKTTTQQAATQVKQTVKKQRDPKIAERFEKRLTDELHKIFDDSDSFYYSRTLDLTNSLQRQYEIEKVLETEEGTSKPVSDITRWWKHVDDRFFWNKHMLKDIIALESPHCDEWVLPIIQGFIHLSQIAVEPADVNPLNTESLSTGSACDESFTLGVISRRSRFQAGTRYNRRGIEPGGKVANYVETEQIVSIMCSDSIHRASFVQVRGSVPIFWSQPDYKFRPPPRLDKGEEETHEAFKKHFESELETYKQVCIVNLVEQQGRERIIWETYGNHVLKYNSPDIVYATFDFHEYCRGMHYENVSILINALVDVINEMRFCWRDARGLICAQGGVFRVNCIDCLDRTNVVQGDYTRTGERKFTGMMKDGVASANRFVIRHFSDAMTQCAIDLALGQPIDYATIDELDSVWRDIKTASLMVFENMDTERPKLEMVPSYFGHPLTQELLSAEIAYGLGRINYTYNNEGGYFHMFRSTTLRFFNNMAVVINTKDEMIGSKALTNMSEQFSKLNKLSHSLNARARPSLQLKFDQGSSRTKKMFTLGGKPDNKKKGSLSDGMSSDYSSDDEHRTNIFEPTLDNYENTQHYIGETSHQKDRENDCELIQNPLYSSKIEPSETFDPTVAIASTVEKQSIKTPSNISKRNPFDLESGAVSNKSRTPEIQIENEGVFSKPIPPSSLILSQKLSHSSSDITYEDNPNLQTEGGAGSTVKQITDQQYEEHKKLQEKWRDCNTRLVAL